MPIVYQSKHTTVYHGDAAEGIGTLGTGSVDLLLTDPPYGVEWQSGRRAVPLPLLAGDAPSDRQGIATDLRSSLKALRRGRHMYVFGPKDILEGLDVTAPVELIWDKQIMNGGNLACQWGASWEPISFATRIINRADTERTPAPARIRRGSVLRYQRLNSQQVRAHPTEKPVPLLCELVESSSRPDELVLDCFAGSMSTGVAAVLRGRRAFLVESDPGYIASGIERIQNAEAYVAGAQSSDRDGPPLVSPPIGCVTERRFGRSHASVSADSHRRGYPRSGPLQIQSRTGRETGVGAHRRGPVRCRV